MSVPGKRSEDEYKAALADVEALLEAAKANLDEDGFPWPLLDDPEYDGEMLRVWGAPTLALAAAVRRVEGTST